jgi:hypothetical protein
METKDRPGSFWALGQKLWVDPGLTHQTQDKNLSVGKGAHSPSPRLQIKQSQLIQEKKKSPGLLLLGFTKPLPFSVPPSCP